MTVSLGAVHRHPLRSLEVMYPTACAEDWEEKISDSHKKESLPSAGSCAVDPSIRFCSSPLQTAATIFIAR